MLIGLSEKERGERLQDKILKYWNARDKKFVNIHKLIFSDEILVFTFFDILRAKNVNTKRGDDFSLDGIGVGKMHDLSKSLVCGTWEPGIVRRVMIQKKNSGEFRSLIVISILDKIVAIAIKTIFISIFEKHLNWDPLPPERYFHDTSHGFRPARSCHTALNVIITWGLVPWVLKADIKECYDTIDQERLMSILSMSIKDQLLTDDMYKIFQSSVINLKKSGQDCSKSIGVPQGNLMSPMLVNIYLNEFDYFIDNLKKKFNKASVKTKITPEWPKVVWVSASELSVAKTKKAKANLKINLDREKVKFAVKSGIQKNSRMDESQGKPVHHKDIFYVRHADDYLIGVKGSKSLAFEIRKRASDFLKSALHFSLKDNEIVHTSSDKVKFLGFHIKVPKKLERSGIETRKILSFKKIRNRIAQRKKVIESKYQKSLLAIYNSILKEKLKRFSKKEKINRDEKIKQLATYGAITLDKLAFSNNKKWDTQNTIFNDWISCEILNLTESWIQEDLLKEHGFNEVSVAYTNFINAIQDALSSNYINEVKLSKIKQITANPNYKQMHVDDHIVLGQSQGLSLRIYAPIWEIRNRMQTWGMISFGGSPKASGAIFRYHDISIIAYYKEKALGFLNYYRPAVNYYDVKKLADYYLRWSLLHTLAGKHKLKIYEIIREYGKTPKIVFIDKNKKLTLVSYLTSNMINDYKRGFTTIYNSFLELKNMDKLSIPKVLFSKKCAIIGCLNTDIEVHHIRTLKRVCSSFTIESALNWKQIPLCKQHYVEWHNLDKNQIEKFYLNKV